jgi:hypothetical protein
MISIFNPPPLTRPRMIAAMSVAVVVDLVQLALGPLGFLVIDEALDVITAVVITLSIGFHPLLLPTFIAELLPLVEMVPTWTACTLAVLALRKRAQARQGNPPPTAPTPSPNPDNMKRARVLEEPDRGSGQ